MPFQDYLMRSKQCPWSYSTGSHSSSHQRHARWDNLMSFQATCHALHCITGRIKRQGRRLVASPTISISRLKDNDYTATLWAVMSSWLWKSKDFLQPRCDKTPNIIKASHNTLGRRGVKREPLHELLRGEILYCQSN